MFSSNIEDSLLSFQAGNREARYLRMNFFLLVLGCVVNAQEFNDVKEMMEFNVARWFSATDIRFGYRLLDIGYRILDIGYWILDIINRISDIRYRISDSTHPVSDIGWWEQMRVHLVPCQGPGFQGQQLKRFVIVFTYLLSVLRPLHP